MSRCTPTSHTSWNRRLKRHGGLQGIVNERIRQFAQLRTTQQDSLNVVEAFRIASQVAEPDAKSHHQLKIAQNTLDLAALAIEFLEGNARRVLSPSTEEALGWRP